MQQLVTSEGLELGVAFDGDGDRMLAVDERGEPVDGDQILAVLALHLGVELVAVTVMTNLGFHRLMAERGVEVVTTPVGDRYVLEALRREGGLLGGEQSGHLIWLGNHVTGDGLAAALLLCAAARGRSLSDAAAVMPRYPQVEAQHRGLAAVTSRRRSSTRSTGSTPSSASAAACSFARRARSPSSASWPSPKMPKMQRSCVLASPRSWNESSAEPDEGRRRALTRLMS